MLVKNNAVIKQWVHENYRKAAKTPLPINYVKWNDCILQIRPWQIECQQSVNDFWSWKSANWKMIWSLLFIITVLAAYAGKNFIDDIATNSWK